ncbi:MAG: PEP-CTERM sorting domain-containing protein [Phycisphaerae bacterium]
MKRSGLFAMPLCALVALTSTANAVEVRVEVLGDVGFNVIQGGMAGVQAGDPVSMSFSIDSDSFVNSPNFPTRGYDIDLSSWAMTVGGVNVPITDPQPFGTPYFILRDNDPAVDGFFISRNIDVPQPITVNIPGLTPNHDLDFIRTFNDGTPLASLDILDAVGTYGLENLSVFGWTIGRFGNAGAEYNYNSISITVVPEPASLMLLGVAALAWRRR